MSSQTAAEEEHIYTDAFVGDNSWNGRERNVILLNRGQGSFLSAAPALGLDSLLDARGLALADFDQDGDIDLAINNYLAPAALYRNERGSESAWAAFRLRGAGLNRDAVGAILRARVGGRLQTRLVGAGHGYASQFSLEQHFGLGAAEALEELTVTWPSGRVERFGPFAARARYALAEGEGRALSSLASAAGASLPSGLWTVPEPAQERGQVAALAILILAGGVLGVAYLGSPASARVP